MRYIFSCPRCGGYDVSREQLEAFVTPKLKMRLDRKPNAAVALLKFKASCPRCRPESKTEVTLSVISPR